MIDQNKEIYQLRHHSRIRILKNGRKMGDWGEREIVFRKRETPCRNRRVHTYGNNLFILGHYKMRLTRCFKMNQSFVNHKQSV